MIRFALTCIFALIVGLSVCALSFANHQWLAIALGIGCSWITVPQRTTKRVTRRPVFVPQSDGRFSRN